MTSGNAIRRSKASLKCPLAVASLLGLGCLAGCEGRQAHATSASVSAASPLELKKAKPTPEVIAKAEAILAAKPDAPIGAQERFTVNGRRYVARFEEHDNASNEPGRPPGKHKGITVYEAD